MTGQVHIHAPQGYIGRAVRRCTTCRCRRRFLVEHFEWYASRWTCGGCGYTFVSGEGRERRSEKGRAIYRRWVQDTWPRVESSQRAIEKMLKETRCES